MKVVFRVDSGLHMGIGHVMRCLTLADELALRGHKISFITKNHQGFTSKLISDKYPLYVIEGGVQCHLDDQLKKNYANWLGEDWSADLLKTNKILNEMGAVDLVVVDHYSLGAQFEKGLTSRYVMVIDDLINRAHDCDLLLDQNITASSEKYLKLCQANTDLLMGPSFSLLRPEFAIKHKRIELKDEKRSIDKIMVFFGASDVNGDCLKLAKAISNELKKRKFTFILSEQHTDFAVLKEFLNQYSNVELLSFIPNMSDLMVDHDLFIGAGGTTSWERACLGMASVLCSVADNQTMICEELFRQKICHYLGHSIDMTPDKWMRFFNEIVPNNSLWYTYRINSFNLVDGTGTQKVATLIEQNRAC